MKRIVVPVAALAAALAWVASSEAAPAQRQQQSVMTANGAKPKAASATAMSNSAMSGSGGAMATPSGPVQFDGGYGGYGAGDGWYSGDGYSGDGGGYCDSCGGYGSCDCDTGCYAGGDCSWWNCYGLCGSGPRSWYVTADYLYVRASFSQAVAYIENNIDDIEDESDFVHELDFQHESSYRFGGGYRLNCCDEEIRFMYTRFQSGASAIAPVDDSTQSVSYFVPYEVFSPDGPTYISADVDVNSFDLDYRKTIPLGGCQSCDCGDTCCDTGCGPCGCADTCCPPSCPAWDITWSGGLRFADVDWSRTYVAYSDAEVFRSANPTLHFAGGGPRVGLEGRRYFGSQNWGSIFLRGDISLLLGSMEEKIVRVDEDGIRTSLTDRGRRIIPVTDIEAGLSAQLTRRSLLSAGYLFSAWHDLGFRDVFQIDTLVESNVTDTANILGFDGFFARLEFGY